MQDLVCVIYHYKYIYFFKCKYIRISHVVITIKTRGQDYKEKHKLDSKQISTHRAEQYVISEHRL